MSDENNYLLFDTGELQYAVSMGYVGYIISASETFRRCMPPQMPPYVKCVMSIEQELVPIVDLNRLEGTAEDYIGEIQLPLIVILNYCNRAIGVLADKISLQLGKTVEKNQIDPISKRAAVTFDGNIFVLLDVPEFYKKIRAR